MPTKIEWTEETWNPIIGCSKVSPGCDNCYAERMAGRLSNMPNSPDEYAAVVKVATTGPYMEGLHGIGKWNGKTRLVDSALEKPLKWKKPRTIFVCSMGDLFHESVLHSWITAVLEVVQKCPQHTFLALTKREDMMKKYFDHLSHVMQHGVCNIDFLPISNLYLGVTVENQPMANKRIPVLLSIPAAKYFVSVEPMLGPVNFTQFPPRDRWWTHFNAFTGCQYNSINDISEERYNRQVGCEGNKPAIDWVICGSESGSGRRECNEDWVRSLRDQCEEAHVPFFLKQLHRNGKKVTTPELDGKVWRERP